MFWKIIITIGAISWFSLALFAAFTDVDFARITVVTGFAGCGFYMLVSLIES